MSFFKKFNLTNLLVYLYLAIFIYLFCYTFYRAEFVYDGNQFSYYYKYYLIFIFGICFWILVLFFNRKLKINKIICFEPNKSYVRILKNLNIKNLIVNAYGIGQFNKYYKIFFPRYKFFSKNLDLITYAYYNKQDLLNRINLDFRFKKNISIIKSKIYLKKIKKMRTKIDLIKIDVNGHELSVLKGLSNIIKRDNYENLA